MSRYKLNIYASGSGALSLCWLRDGIAGGKMVTRTDAIRAATSAKLRGGSDGKSFADLGYKILQLGTKRPQFVIYKPLTRVSENVVEREGRKLRYACTRNADGFVFELEVFDDEFGRVVENVDARSNIRFFIENENVINNATCVIEPKRRNDRHALVTALQAERTPS